VTGDLEKSVGFYSLYSKRGKKEIKARIEELGSRTIPSRRRRQSWALATLTVPQWFTQVRETRRLAPSLESDEQYYLARKHPTLRGGKGRGGKAPLKLRGVVKTRGVIYSGGDGLLLQDRGRGTREKKTRGKIAVHPE